MGRLTKAKIDKITNLRDEGYTQKEVAQKVDVDIKTVRKYDPQRQTVKLASEEEEISLVQLLKRIERLEENFREIGFGKMIGCRYGEQYYPDPEDEDDFYIFCNIVSWDHRPPALEAFHGSCDDQEHYNEKEHAIKVRGKWYQMATPGECASCSSFYPRE